MVNFVVSQNCLICGQSSIALMCQYCQNDLEIFDWAKYDYNLLNWPRARSGLKNFDGQQLLALADYQWPWSSLLTGLKFASKLPHAKILAQLFFQQLDGHPGPLPEAIIPVALHCARYRRRKFNQCIEIANHLAKLLGIVMNTSMITRIKATQAQTTLSGAKRKDNVKGAFALNIPATYRHIALIDDVVTTGATVDAIYKLLREHNPGLKIEVWAICLTLEHR